MKESVEKDALVGNSVWLSKLKPEEVFRLGQEAEGMTVDQLQERIEKLKGYPADLRMVEERLIYARELFERMPSKQSVRMWVSSVLNRSRGASR